MAMLRRFFFLFLLSLVCAGAPACIGPFQAPLAQAPLFSRAGEAEVGVGARILVPNQGMVAMARVAVSDYLRAGVVVSGALLRRGANENPPFGLQLNQRYRAIYGEAFVGAEKPTGIFRYGGLLGGGYGVSEYVYRTCDDRGDMVSEGWGPPHCYGSITHRENPRYLRVYAQPYIGIAPPGFYKAALGLRFPVVHDLRSAHTRALPELFFGHSVLLRRVRLELQAGIAPDQLLTFQLAAYVRFGPGANERGSPRASEPVGGGR